MMIGLMESAIALGSKFIKDEDKQTEFAYKTLESMLASRTYRWVDGIVKLSFAAEQITKGLLRPLGSAAMFIFAAYCQTHDIQLDSMIQTMLYGAPVAWGTSRHIEKKSAAMKPTKSFNDEYD